MVLSIQINKDHRRQDKLNKDGDANIILIIFQKSKDFER